MIEISSAVSSSMSSTRAGIACCSAIFDARQRRSPAMSWNRPPSIGPDEDRLEDAVLADGRGELARAVASSNARRGCSGLGSMRSTGTILTPVDGWVVSGDSRLTIAGGSSRSSDSRRAAAARKSGLAKFDHLPGELAIGARGLGRAGVAS